MENTEVSNILTERTKFYHLFLNNLDTPEALKLCEQFYNENSPHTIYFINAHCYNVSMRNHAYYNALSNANLILNDGIGIKIASYFSKLKLKENMNGTDYIPKLLWQAGQLHKKVFLLGAKDNIPQIARKNIESRFPGIEIVGSRSGYFTKEESESVVATINNSKAELLVVAMGVPRQEIWLNENISKFTNVKIAVAGGAILDFLAERVKRAPIWMQKAGIEWFFRLKQEPRRLFKRYVIGNGVFLASVLFNKSPEFNK
ncbi:MAG: WecB/TagA/CpsF family glycosyltransferase [Bacteroidetes bacterium]|jgi:N-acetylglucosaminyldiphosphoundecaprenol N-acetyl-beta-D-mannosaminyltransferase|nr:WecB/TagA/CpsF family glycosyltransferase [Bacteroidota bacterium]